MRRILLGMCVLLLLPAVVWAQGPEARGKVIAVQGTALIERPGLAEPIPVAVGFELFQNDWFVTGAEGRAKLLLAGQLVVFVAPNTYLRIEHTIHNLKDRARVSYLHLKGGAVRVLVRRRPNYSHTVRLEGQSFIVSGHNGYFLANVDAAQGETTIYNIAGDLRVGRLTGASVMLDLPPGSMVAAKAGEIFGESVSVDDAKGRGRRLLASTDVDNDYIWANRPGAIDSLVERREGSVTTGAAPNAHGLLTASEGEGGADFDAFRPPGLLERLRQEDLPRPPDTPPGDGTPGFNQNPVNVRVRLHFPDDKRKEDDND